VWYIALFRFGFVVLYFFISFISFVLTIRCNSIYGVRL
jgi:hypothetical protein